MKIVFIHGAGATKDSFNYIEPHIDNRFERVFLEYHTETGFNKNLHQMVEATKEISGDGVFFVSHSLGGVYALHIGLQLRRDIRGSVSIASPFNGSDSAVVLNMIKPCQLYKDISPYSTPIYSSHGIKITYPWTQIVTTGSPSHWMNAPNDGVVTKQSMTFRKDMKFIEVNSGHYEIMLRREPIDIINTCVGKLQA